MCGWELLLGIEDRALLSYTPSWIYFLLGAKQMVETEHLEVVLQYRLNDLHCSVWTEAAEVGAQRERARK